MVNWYKLSRCCLLFSYPHLLLMSDSVCLSCCSWPYTCCHFWSQRICFRQLRRVVTGAFLQRITCSGGKNAKKMVIFTAFDKLCDFGNSSLNHMYIVSIWLYVMHWIIRVTNKENICFAGIDEPLHIKRRKVIKPGFTHSPWKSAYIRQHRIDTNWRRGDLKSPKVACCSLLLTPNSPVHSLIVSYKVVFSR